MVLRAAAAKTAAAAAASPVVWSVVGGMEEVVRVPAVLGMVAVEDLGVAPQVVGSALAGMHVATMGASVEVVQMVLGGSRVDILVEVVAKLVPLAMGMAKAAAGSLASVAVAEMAQVNPRVPYMAEREAASRALEGWELGMVGPLVVARQAQVEERAGQDSKVEEGA